MIGDWVARLRGAVALTKYHFVESVIADRLVTRCGRQLAPRDGTSWSWDTFPQPGARCYYCDRGR